MASSGGWSTSGRSSDAYAGNRFRALQQFFRWLAEEEQLSDPMTRLRAPKVSEKLPVLTSEELSALVRPVRAAASRSAATPRSSRCLTATRIGAGNWPGSAMTRLTRGAATSMWRREITVRGKGSRPRVVRIGHEAAQGSLLPAPESSEDQETERREHQNNPDVGYQPLREVVPEEQDVHADHDGYQREHVQHDGYLSCHDLVLHDGVRQERRPKVTSALGQHVRSSHILYAERRPVESHSHAADGVRRHSRRAALRRTTTSMIAPSPIASARCTAILTGTR